MVARVEVTRPFDGRRILLGVTGGIAAYKSAWIARLLTQAGAAVDVVLTRSATEFIGAITFEALTGRPVHTALIAEGHALDHIKLARAANAVVVAPATADFIARAAARSRRRPAHRVSARHDGAGAPRAGDERSHVGARPDAGEHRASAVARVHGARARRRRARRGRGKRPGPLPEPETIVAHVGAPARADEHAAWEARRRHGRANARAGRSR